MSLTVHLSYLLALLVAGLAQGIKSSLRGQVSVPSLLPMPGAHPLKKQCFAPISQREHLRLER